MQCIHADYFNDVIVLTTQNNSFGPTEISYLENRFTQLANEANRFVVRNGNEPNSGNVTEEKQSELDEVVENTKTNQAFVFDPGDQGERIMNTLEEDGMELAGVCLTHGHFDHVMALPYLMEQKPDLDIYLYEDEADVLADPQLNLGAMMGMDLSLKANHLVKDGEIIDVLGTKVKCIHVPGHTKGGVCYYFADYG